MILNIEDLNEKFNVNWSKSDFLKIFKELKLEVYIVDGIRYSNNMYSDENNDKLNHILRYKYDSNLDVLKIKNILIEDLEKIIKLQAFL